MFVSLTAMRTCMLKKRNAPNVGAEQAWAQHKCSLSKDVHMNPRSLAIVHTMQALQGVAKAQQCAYWLLNWGTRWWSTPRPRPLCGPSSSTRCTPIVAMLCFVYEGSSNAQPHAHTRHPLHFHCKVAALLRHSLLRTDGVLLICPHTCLLGYFKV